MPEINRVNVWLTTLVEFGTFRQTLLQLKSLLLNKTLHSESSASRPSDASEKIRAIKQFLKDGSPNAPIVPHCLRNRRVLQACFWLLEVCLMDLTSPTGAILDIAHLLDTLIVLLQFNGAQPVSLCDWLILQMI